uniref:Uncharacterized protein n=1 Tax=Myoviridae sp. ctCo31 TaxID=2825053 RepID=A0A8S5UMG4_9CAUD|nr:MAG TPA: hypothetical protein [Myoviridae sp. ctCo31]
MLFIWLNTNYFNRNFVTNFKITFKSLFYFLNKIRCKIRKDLFNNLIYIILVSCLNV